ncbi:ABC transporter permease [Rhizobium sp. BK376]|uniref:ABC transporter permease n=1 Tax=Rhizobium sp. BK376 TaxID=2512149 RepID=UPI0010458D19|nr:ABC transporter permease [Rhizobium sp. BK376]TCR71032.1 monosaccharide ABC transporter membrane protein (CUT2 family) [Rhizobium sp. BK376]
MSQETLDNKSGRPVDTRGDAGKSKGFRLDRDVRNAIVLFGVSIVLIAASRVLGPGFGSLAQIEAILLISSFVMVVAFGQQMVILIGGLDLSVASMVTLGGVLTFSWIGNSGTALIWGMPAVLLLTGAIGACSGIGISLLGVPPFIMTLAMGIILYGATLGFTQGTPSGAASPYLSSLFAHTAVGVPMLYLMFLVVLGGWFLQVRTSFGRKLYALGTNPIAAYVAGLPVRRLTILTYAISGASAGLAGMLLVGYVTGVTLTMGQSYLLPSVAAVVIGGTSIVGGRGIYLGAAAGAILLTTLSTIVSSLGIAEGWRTIIYGAVIFVALVLLRDDLRVLLKRNLPDAGKK